MRNRSFLAVAVILGALSVNLAWGQANLPNNPNAATVQGPDPTGMLGYPLATVPATGALPWPVDSVPANHLSSGTLSVVGQSVTVSCGGASVASITMVPNPGWLGQIVFEGSTDGTNYHEIAAAAAPENISTAGFRGYQSVVNNQTAGTISVFQANVGGFTQFRARARFVNAGTGIYVAVNASAGGPYPFSLVEANSSFNFGGFQPLFHPIHFDVVGNTWRLSPAIQSTFGTVQTWNPNQGYFPPMEMSLTQIYKGLTSVGLPQEEALRSPYVFKTAQASAAGNTALWTPTAGTKFRLMRYMVTVTDQATQAGAGTLTCSLFDGAAGVTGQVHDIFVPALGLVNTGSLYSSGWIDLGNGYLSTAANNVLNINLSAALTAGTVRVICCGTEE